MSKCWFKFCNLQIFCYYSNDKPLTGLWETISRHLEDDFITIISALKLHITVQDRNMSTNILNTCKILIHLYLWIWYIWYNLYQQIQYLYSTSHCTLRPRLFTYTTTLTCWFFTLIHICLINTLPFVIDLYDGVLRTIEDLQIAYMTKFCLASGVVVGWSWIWACPNFIVFVFTSVIIGGFDLLPHVLPSNLARWCSSLLTLRSYNTCVYLLLFIGSLFLLYSCILCYNLHPLTISLHMP